MSRKTFRISAGILAAVLGVLIFLNIQMETKQTWDVSYEMVNRNVEWTGAGYSGIYER